MDKELPWCPRGKESAYQRRRLRFNPWSGKIPHTTEQAHLPQLLSLHLEPGSHNYWAWVPQLLSLSTATTEPEYHNYWAQVPQLLSLSTTTTEPEYCNYWARVPQLLKPADPRAWGPQEKSK